MYKRILVTLDGSPLSEAVLPEAAQAAAGMGAQVILLMVAQAPIPAGIARSVEREEPLLWRNVTPIRTLEPRLIETLDQALDRVRSETRAYLEEKARSLRERGIDVETAVRFGEAAEEIIAFARRRDVDLIMMATHGRTGLVQVMFGSVAARVLASGVRPLLLVRPREMKEKGAEEWA